MNDKHVNDAKYQNDAKHAKSQTIRKLIKHANYENHANGGTTLIHTWYNGHKNVVKLLLDSSDRIDMNARSNYGCTAFMYACQCGYKDVVKLLLDHSKPSFDLNAKNENGETAMMIACRRGHQDIVKLIQSKLTFSSKLKYLAKKIKNLLF